MLKVLRPALLVVLVIALAIPAAGYAQDEPQPVTIQGTLELENLVIAIRDAYLEANPDRAVEIDPRGGLSGGFAALCNGEVDIVMSTAPISDSQMAACSRNEQDFIETVLAYEVITLLAPPAVDQTCVPLDQVQDIWQLGGPEAPVWADLGATTLDSEIAFYGPGDLDPAYLLFGDLVPAGDLREDIVTVDDAAAIVDAVMADESSAMGFLSLADLGALNTGGTLFPLDIMNADGQCTPPTVSTVSSGEYPLARTDYLYVNANSAQNPDVQAFLQFALEADGGVKSVGVDQGFTIADPGTYDYGINNVITGNVGRTFTRPASPVTVSSADAGTLSIVGTSMLNDLVDPIRREFSSRFPSVTVDTDTLGNEAGWSAFCKGEADVLQTTRAATENDYALCYANEVEFETVALGAEALVLAVPESADWVDCLSAEQAAVLFRAGTEETPAVTLWSEVDPSWPETEILLVQPPLSNGEADFLTAHLIGDLTLPFRTDGLEDSDVDYRLVGVGNTGNGITYAWWSEYANAPDAAIKLLGVGDECVVPSLETLTDDSYPLAFPVNIHVSRASFTNPMVRAFLWHLYDDATLAQLESAGFAGFDLTAMGQAERDAVFEMLAEYEATMLVEEPAPDDTTVDGANSDAESGNGGE